MNLFPLVKTADQLAAEEREANAPPQNVEEQMSDLAAHIRKAWEKAKTAKITIDEDMIECLRQRNGEYSPAKLAEIKSVRSSEVYIKLTNTKCRAGEAWIREIVFQEGQRPWDIEPTPDPELPPEIELEIKQKFFKEAIYQLLMNASMSGQPIEAETLVSSIQEMVPEFEKRVKKLIIDKAKEAAKEMSREIDDELTEGGFYQALDDCIYDVVTLKATILKGPIQRFEKTRGLRVNPQTGFYEVYFEDRVVSQYESVSPFDMFPAPDSCGIDDGDLIERIYYRPDQLSGLIDLPGYKSDYIRQILKQFREGGFKDWTTDIDQERAEQEQQRKDFSVITDTTKIPCVLWWGTADGKTLTDYGLETTEQLDPDKIYHAYAYLIDKYVIKANLNPDPNGEKPYSKTSFEEIPRAFWGKCPPEMIEDLQTIVNAAARAIVNNVGIASGPQVEVNRDRFPPGYNFSLWPWKVWQSEESQMSSAPAITVYNIPMVVDKLINVMTTFFKMADEGSGIPAYAHGDPNVGGAGNTASGLSMLLSGAARGIKDVIKHFDFKLIGPTITRQFFLSLANKPRKGIIGDLKVVPKGTAYLSTKEQQAIRMMEFARETNNAVDLQLQGPEGRKYILKTAAQSMNIDPDKAFPEEISMMNPLQALNMPPANNQPGAATLGPDGNPAQGVDFRMFNQEGKQ